MKNAIWIFSKGTQSPLSWYKTEARKIVAKLTGTQLSVGTKTSSGFNIVVGSPDSNPIVKQAVKDDLLDISDLGRDDYLLQQHQVDGKRVLFITGENETACMYGLFAFFETLGCYFLISKDIYPPKNPQLVVPELNITGITKSSWRGQFVANCGTPSALMSIEDYEKMFNQMAKLRFNKIYYYHFEHEPFLDYSYKGERKITGDVTHLESGCLSLGRFDQNTYKVSDMIAGKGPFKRKNLAPMEFQNVKSSEEALDKGQGFMQKLISLAKSRGIATWISFDPAFVPLNMAKYLRRMPRSYELYSALTSFTDPVVDVMNANRIKSILKAYPDIEGISLCITEGFYEDKYPESQAIINEEWPKYKKSFALLRKHWGKHWPGIEGQTTKMRADIGFVERVKTTIETAREIKADLPISVFTVCKAYLLTHLDKVLPDNIPFIDIESQSLWTLDGAPLHLFKQMKNRECVIVPRANDDGSFAGLQFNLNLYERDGFVASRKQNNTNGLLIQTTHMAGNDHNMKYLATGMWDENITPSGFYNTYTQTLFGKASANNMKKAFCILEENELFMGGRGMKNMPYSLNPAEVVFIKSLKNHKTPFYDSPTTSAEFSLLTQRSEIFKGSIKKLKNALLFLEKAKKTCISSGKKELQYLITKTVAYRTHLQTLLFLRDAHIYYANSFSLLKDAEKGVPFCKKELVKTLGLIKKAEQSAIVSAKLFSKCAQHTTDLLAIWQMNHMIFASRIFSQYVTNIHAYFDGKEYWGKVDWNLLFAEDRYPLCELTGSADFDDRGV